MASSNLTYFLVAILLIGRLGDLLSTYFVTPNLELEANFIIRKFKWPYALTTLLICLIPLYSNSLGVMLIVPTYFVCFHNFSQVGMARFFGENDLKKIMIAAIQKNGIKMMLLYMYVAHLFLISVGLLVILITEKTDWGYWIGCGIVLFSIAVTLHKTIYYLKLSKEGKNIQYSIKMEEL